MTQAVFGTGAGARTVSCVYDGFGRLKKVNDNGKETEYTYDADGLRSSKSTGGSTERYIYDNGQLVFTLVPAATSVYTGTIPASGYGSTTFGMAVGEQYFVEINGTMYSGTVRLDFGTAEAAMPYATSGDPSAGFGTFVILEAGDVTIVSPDGGVSGTISGPAGAQVKVYMGDPRKATTAYIRGLGLIASRTGSTPTYYHYDAHGNVIQTTDANGNLVKNYYYDAFGVEQNADPADTNPFRYCGEQYDTETGNYYLRARYYAPGVGRFTQEDPVRDGLNWYVYCAGNPVRYSDPRGMRPGDLFDSLDEAAIDAANYLMDLTVQYDEEMIALFSRKGEKFTYYQVKNEYSTHEERKYSFSYVFYGHPLAVIHTHVFFELNHLDNEFSKTGYSAGPISDVENVQRSHMPLYLAAPTGELKVLEYDRYKADKCAERYVSGNTYIDSRYAAYDYLKGSRWDLLKSLFPNVDDMEILKTYVQQSAVSRAKKLNDTVQELLQHAK